MRALITGVSGQDGSYLAEHLLANGYEVHGIVRSSASAGGDSVEVIRKLADDNRLTLHVSDIADEGSLARIITEVRPGEIYNLAAQSSVRDSFDQPVHTGDVTALGAVRILESIRNIDKGIRFYQASSSEMFGAAPPPQNEDTPFAPRSPYAIAKLYAHWSTINYREAFGIHASAGILFNHESPRRHPRFVTRKITRAVARIAAGERRTLRLGNIDARRDWGHARDYVKAMHLIARHDEPLSLVIGTGESRTIRQFLEVAFACAGLEWERFVEIDPGLYRPTDVQHVEADVGRASQILGWQPTVSFEGMVEEMVAYDSDALK